MQKFEYKFIEITGYSLEFELNNLGEDGWEAVSCTMHNFYGSASNLTTASYAVLLKKLKKCNIEVI